MVLKRQGLQNKHHVRSFAKLCAQKIEDHEDALPKATEDALGKAKHLGKATAQIS